MPSTSRKRRIGVAALLLLILWLGIWGISKFAQPPTRQPPAKLSQETGNVPHPPVVQPRQVNESDTRKVAEPPREALGRIYVERSLADPDYDWKIPIEFYGKVIDQDSNAVSGATIEFLWTDLSREGTSRHSTESDERGEFGLTGVRGKSLGVEVSKTGYYRSVQKSRSSFEYANPFEPNFHQPDRANPVVFHLRRKGKAEPLVHHYVKLPLNRDGDAVRLDLQTGRPSATGQLELRAWKQNGPDATTRRFDWWLTLHIPGGGLLETEEEFPFRAPEDGYVEALKHKFVASEEEGWQSGIKRQYFLAFGIPRKHARLNLRLQAQGSMCYLDLWVNPSGSRNLEYDPAVQPKPKFLE
jgi:hypothetical protein